MKLRNNKLNSKGFTLIELLIVIIIIGILAAIAFVAYNGTTNKAKQSDAQSTVSEVQSKLAEYNSDNGYYPLNLTTFNTWLASSTGGNNTTLSTTFVGPAYAYAPTDSTGNTCNNTTDNCTEYTVTYTYTASNGGGTANITATN